jgi:hypothetical protein
MTGPGHGTKGLGMYYEVFLGLFFTKNDTREEKKNDRPMLQNHRAARMVA